MNNPHILVGSSTRFVLKYFLTVANSTLTLSYHNLGSIYLHTYRHPYFFFFKLHCSACCSPLQCLLGVHISQVVMRYVAFHKNGGIKAMCFHHPTLA